MGIGIILTAAACSSSNDSPATSQAGTGGIANGGNAATGGAKATGGASSTQASSSVGGSWASSTGGAAATGGSQAATGGNATTGGASATGGSKATGGTTSSVGGTAAGGGSSATGGKSSVGGTSAAGGSSAAITCPLDNQANDSNFYGTSAYCTPANTDLTLITGTLSIGTLNVNATGGTIAISGAPPVTGALAYSRPFNSSNCANSGLNATVTGSNPAKLYTGISFTIKNSAATSSTLNVYLADRVTVASSNYYVVGSAGIAVAAGATVTKTVKWADLVTNCSMGSAANFDPTQILALALGFPTTDAVNLTISNVSFATN